MNHLCTSLTALQFMKLAGSYSSRALIRCAPFLSITHMQAEPAGMPVLAAVVIFLPSLVARPPVALQVMTLRGTDRHGTTMKVVRACLTAWLQVLAFRPP